MLHIGSYKERVVTAIYRSGFLHGHGIFLRLPVRISGFPLLFLLQGIVLSEILVGNHHYLVPVWSYLSKVL